VASGRNRRPSGEDSARAGSRRTEDCLEALHKLREDPDLTDARAAIAQFLAHKSNLLVAKAAKLAGEAGIESLEPQLVAAFHRFMKNPAVTDKGCEAKTEIVRALEAMGAAEPEVFLAGIRHVQMEGAYGPPIDTAVGLRAASAMGLCITPTRCSSKPLKANSAEIHKAPASFFRFSP